MSGQGASTIDPCAAISFMWRTVQSARKHGVMHTVAQSAQLLCGHRSHVGESRSRMTHPRESDARRNIGTFRRKGHAKNKKRKKKPPGKRQAWTPLNRWLSPECLVEAAANRFRGLRPGKWQAWFPLTTEGSGLSACPKLPRSVLRIWGLANGRLERP